MTVSEHGQTETEQNTNSKKKQKHNPHFCSLLGQLIKEEPFICLKFLMKTSCLNFSKKFFRELTYLKNNVSSIFFYWET